MRTLVLGKEEVSQVSISKKERWLDVEKDITFWWVFQVYLCRQSRNGYKTYQLAEGYVPCSNVMRDKSSPMVVRRIWPNYSEGTRRSRATG
ncbi:hypothetical protein V6N11_058422 [Hibiscus sabdariffa]|uniref:Uncharacterized protein n=1 Tax=Hibiscus sabdariffa TaxID=183260 RepID=A0ABR2U4H4_9ROSI